MHPNLQSNVSLIRKSLIGSFQLWIKLMFMIVPINLAVKICEEMGLISVLGDFLKPVMIMVGLPGIIGLVWAVTLMTNLWAGALLFVSLAAVEPLTTAQVTVLGIMMLIAHGLPLELRMVQKCGVSLMFSLVLRVASALGLAYLFNLTFVSLDILQTPAKILLDVASGDSQSWANWLVGQLESYGLVLAMLMVLVLFLDYLKYHGLVYRLGQMFALPTFP
jgi:spore maturation protein SpmB